MHRRSARITASCAIGLAACVAQVPSPADSGLGLTSSDASGWVDGPALLGPLQEHSVVALLGEVVVLGGYDDERRMVDRVEAFDPRTNRWRSLAPLPEPSHHVNAAVVGDHIYVLGVLQGGFLEEPVLWIYAPTTDSWNTGARPPETHTVGASVVGVHGTEVHVVGGLQSVRAVALHSVYDTADDQWRLLPDSPRARDHAAGGLVDGTLYAVGGRAGAITSVQASVDRFDTATGQWSPGRPIPTARAGVAHAFDARGHLHVVGGEGSPDAPSGVFGEHEIYDPAEDAWSASDPMPHPRHGMGAVFVEGVLYVPGGAAVQGFGAVDRFDRWSPHEGR